MRIKLTGIIASLALALAGALFVYAQPHKFQDLPGAEGNQSGKYSGRRMERFAKRLGLSDAQKSQIQQIVASEKPNFQPLVQQLAQNRKELRAATTSGQFNEDQVRAIASSQAQTMTNLIVERARMQSKIYAVLTLEQRSKATQLREGFEKRGTHNHQQSATDQG